MMHRREYFYCLTLFLNLKNVTMEMKVKKNDNLIMISIFIFK